MEEEEENEEEEVEEETGEEGLEELAGLSEALRQGKDKRDV